MSKVAIVPRLPHELLGDKRMLLIDSGIQLERQGDESADVAMTGQVLPNQSTAICQAIRESRARRQQKKVRAPDVASCHHKRTRPDLDRIGRTIARNSLRHFDAITAG